MNQQVRFYVMLTGVSLVILLYGIAGSLSAATLSGVVRDAESGRPISSAEVTIPALGKGTHTLLSGVFRIEDIPDGEFLITTTSQGYTATNLTVVIGPDPDSHPRSILLHRSTPQAVPAQRQVPLSMLRVPASPAQESSVVATERVVKGGVPDNFVARAEVGIGYGSNLVDNDFPGFHTDAITPDPVEQHGSGYQATADDFTRDNLTLFSHQAPPNLSGEVTIGNRILDSALGYAVTGTVGQTYRYAEGARNYEAVDADNRAFLIRRQHRIQGEENTSYALGALLDFSLGSGSRINASVSGIYRRNLESRLLSDSNYSSSPVLNTITGTQLRTRTLADVMVSGHHALGLFDLDWRGGWTGAYQSQPDRTEWSTSAALTNDVVASTEIFSGAVRDWQQNDDNGYVTAADLAWKGLGDYGVTLSTGGLLRIRQRDNSRNIYRLVAVPDSQNRTPEFVSIDTQPWKVLNAGGSADYANNNYSSEEDVAAGYLMGVWKEGKWKAVAGIRVEATNAEYATNDINVAGRISATKSYVDLLPNAQVEYALTDNSHLLIAAGRSLRRPNFFDLVPYNYFSGEYRLTGNPQLKATRTTTIDVQYASVVDSGLTFSLGGLYQHIADPIETILDLSNPAIPTLIPSNLGDARSIGGEAAASILLPAWMQLTVSYTYTNSAITSNKIVNDRMSGSVLNIPETRPLQGQPEHAGTILLTFDRHESGTLAQINVKYTGSHIVRVSLYKGLDHYESGTAVLNFSGSQRIADNLSVFLKVENILDSPFEVQTNNGLLIEQEEIGRTAMLGVTCRW